MVNRKRGPSGAGGCHDKEAQRRVSFTLTPTALAGLEALALKQGYVSGSEFLESLGQEAHQNTGRQAPAFAGWT